MRILHVLDHSIPLHSGYAFRTLAILRHQRKMGWRTEHVTGTKQGPSPGAVEEVGEFRFFRTAPGSRPFDRLPVLKQVAVIRDLRRRLAEVIEEVKPDVLHAHSPALNGVAAVQAGRAARLPVVYECRALWEDAAADHGTSRERGPRYRLTRALETWVVRRADAVTTICEGLRGDLAGRGIPEGKITVIPNAVDVERFPVLSARDAALEAELGLGGHPVLGFIGSFYAYEGLPLLLEALGHLRGAHPRVRLLLVGGGPDEERLRREAGERGLAEAVLFVGRVPNDTVARYYSLCDAMVYPRLSMRLTDLVTPLKPLEAMAQGKVVVASDVGGHRELIRPDDTGLLFPAGDARALAAVLARLLDRPSTAEALRAAGRRFVEQERTWESSVARYEAVYGPLVGLRAAVR